MSGRFLLGISQPARPDEAPSRLSQYIDFALLRLFLGVEELTTTQIAQALPLAPSSISRTVTRLEGPRPEAATAQRPEGRHSNVDRRRDGADAGPAPACPGIRGRALRERQRRRDGGLYFRHLNNHGELCCPDVIDDSATQDLSRANTGSAQERLKLGRRAETGQPTACGQLFSW